MKKHLRIAIFIRSTTFHNKSGGLEVQNKLLAEGLVKKGHSVTVVTTSLPNNGRKCLIEREVGYYFTDSPSGRYSKKWWEESARAYGDLSKKDIFDVIISQSSAGRSVFRFNDVRKVSICHGTAFGEAENRFRTIKSVRNLGRFLLKDVPSLFLGYLDDANVFKNSDIVVCVSDVVKDKVNKEYPGVKKKTLVIPNGIDLSVFNKKSLKNEKRGGKDGAERFTFLYVGRIDKEKGIGILLSAFLKGRRFFPDAKLVLVGTGPHIDDFKRRFLPSDEGQGIVFAGEVSNEKVVDFYLSSDVFVLPSVRQEGFPMVIIEAMAAGLPIIASEIGGIPFAIKNMENGILVKPGSVSDLLKALTALYKDKILRTALRAKAKRDAQEKYSQKAMVEKYLDLF